MPRRRADRVDTNQAQIVKELRSLGLSVEVGHDDILVGYQGRTYWFEIKTGPKAEVKAAQKKLLSEFKGHYEIVYNTEMILKSIGMQK